MADFGIKATELQDPQARGSAPISPVQDPATQFPNLGGLSGLMDGLVNKKNKPYSSNLSQFTQEYTTIQQARETGDISATAAANRQAQLVVKYQKEGAGFGTEYAKDLAGLVNNLRVGTRIERNDALVNAEEDANLANFNELKKAGFYPFATEYNSLTPEEQRATNNYIAAAKNAEYIGKQQHEAWQREAEIKREGRSEGSWNREANDYVLKKQAQDGMGALMSAGIGVMDSQLTHIMGNTEYTPEQKQQAYSNSLQKAKAMGWENLKGDPDLYNKFSSFMDDTAKLGALMLDPAKKTQAVVDEYNRMMAAGKIDFLNASPSNVRAAVVSSVLPNNVAAMMAVDIAGMDYLQKDLLSSQNQRPLESVVTGNTKGQQITFQSAQDTIRRTLDGKSLNVDRDINDAAKVAASTVKALSTFTPGTKNSMAPSLDFVASPEYAHLVSKGLYDPQESIKAASVMNDLYLPALAESIRNIITQPIGDNRYEDGKPSKDNPTLSNLIEFVVDNNGKISIEKKISPEYQKKITASPIYIDRMIRQANESLSQNLNSALRANAHLEGRTDYKAYFAENAPYFLRGVFPPAGIMERLKSEGYSGTGNINNPANWSGNSGFPSNRE